MKLQRLLVYSALNLLMAVMVGKGMLHLSNGASAGYLELLLGALVLICIPWVQDRQRDVNPDWPKSIYWALPMGIFGLYAFFGMVNPFV